jgi:hypothetical protein
VCLHHHFAHVRHAIAGSHWFPGELAISSAAWAYALLAFFLIHGRRLISPTYTSWNCSLLAYSLRKIVPKRATFSIQPTASAYSNRYTLVERAIHGSMPLMLPFVVVNSWSIFVSFNVMRLFDAKLYDDFAQKYRSHEAAAIRLAALPQSEVVATSAAGRAATLS